MSQKQPTAPVAGTVNVAPAAQAPKTIGTQKAPPGGKPKAKPGQPTKEQRRGLAPSAKTKRNKRK